MKTLLINDRIDVRISREQKETIKYASELAGFKSLSEFVLYCLNTEAKKIVKEENEILKSIRDKKVFVQMLLNPPPPNDKLKEAFLNYQKMNNENTGSRKNK